MRLKVFRKTGTTTYLTVCHSVVEPLTSQGLKLFATRIGVQAGDLLGLRTGGTEGTDCYPVGGSGDSARQQASPGLPDPQVGTTFTALFPSTFLLNVAAVVEPDTDRDVYGDETQDKCVGTAGPFNGCPNELALGKAKGKNGKVKVTATVPGAGTISAGSASDRTLATAAKNGRQLKPVTKTLTSTTEHQVTLTLKLTKAAKRKLTDDGKLKVRVKAVYTPAGGPPGSKTTKATLKA